MAISIGPRGFQEIVSSRVGPERLVRIVEFQGRADTGSIPGHFNAQEPPVAIICVNTGLLETGHFTGATTGAISQDTGAGNASSKTFLAIVTDTGAGGL